VRADGTAVYRYPPTNWSGGGVLTGPNGILNPSFEYAANVGSPDGDYLSMASSQLSGASFMSDSRTSVDGLHSLRLVAPSASGGGYVGGPYQSQLFNGTTYSLSVHAKAAKAGTILDLGPAHSLQLAHGTQTQFNLTTQWAKYEVRGVATSDSRASVSHYSLRSVGTAWLDSLDIHQVNDCPYSNTSGGKNKKPFGFFNLQLSPFDKSSIGKYAVAVNGNASGCCEAGWTGADYEGLCTQTKGWFWWCRLRHKVSRPGPELIENCLRFDFSWLSY
jgi:hypothetical protein